VSVEWGWRKSERKTSPSGWDLTAQAIRESRAARSARRPDAKRRAARAPQPCVPPPLSVVPVPWGQFAAWRAVPRRTLPSPVAMAGEEAGEALLAQSPSISGARVALEESQGGDRRVEPTDKIPAAPGQRRPRVRPGGDWSARHLGFHKVLAFSRVRALMAFVSSESGTQGLGTDGGRCGRALPGRRPRRSRTYRRRPGSAVERPSADFGVDREHHETRFQQTLEHNAIRTLDGDALDL
jgi:hypothetical protein